MEGERKRKRMPKQHVPRLRRQGLATTPQDEDGVSMALLDAIIAMAHILAGRPLAHWAIREALKDLGSNAAVLSLIRAGHELRYPEGLHVASGRYGCAYQDAGSLGFCAPVEMKNATRGIVYPDGMVAMYCEEHYLEGMMPFYLRLTGKGEGESVRGEG